MAWRQVGCVKLSEIAAANKSTTATSVPATGPSLYRLRAAVDELVNGSIRVCER